MSFTNTFVQLYFGKVEEMESLFHLKLATFINEEYAEILVAYDRANYFSHVAHGNYAQLQSDHR